MCIWKHGHLQWSFTFNSPPSSFWKVLRTNWKTKGKQRNLTHTWADSCSSQTIRDNHSEQPSWTRADDDRENGQSEAEGAWQWELYTPLVPHNSLLTVIFVDSEVQLNGTLKCIHCAQNTMTTQQRNTVYIFIYVPQLYIFLKPWLY